MTTPAAQGILILGSTGSIGNNTLDVVRRHPDRYRVVALTARHNVAAMVPQCAEFRPDVVVMQDADAAEKLRLWLRRDGLTSAVYCGEDALQEIAQDPRADTVVAAIVGAAGLLPTLAAARAGKRVLLANKEALVMSGALLMDTVRRHGATLLPIDSEHNAVLQCLPQAGPDGTIPGIRKVLLTASGGPLREYSPAALAEVTPDQALAHPNWNMGKKVSIDSATLMNKGLEVIEACWLFGLSIDQIEVVVHPQSIIHSMVSYIDGSVLAQLGNPDMRTPIAHALAWPERIAAGVAPPNFGTMQPLTFQQPDHSRFPCLQLAIAAQRAGGTAGAVLNAANEVAVAAFLDGQLPFTGIPALIDQVLEHADTTADSTLDNILAADTQTRECAAVILARNAMVA